ncbi:hypothetical protein [Streptomyces sp. NRRL F-5123]|uniref:hypothetical protein n=1 Tax=Streptomyces sp. NRRL F-5123 TaxID=1463856 RepID=UPI0004E2333E|nr:hypothetical protein [Streptomyces sp. NRRL F-5123]
MLRREGDGTAWWQARQRLLGRRTDVPHVLKLRLVAEGDSADVAQWTRRIIEQVHGGVGGLDPAASADGAQTGFAETFERLPAGPEGEDEALARLADGRTSNVFLRWSLASMRRDAEETEPSAVLILQPVFGRPTWELGLHTGPAQQTEDRHQDIDALWEELLDSAGRLPLTVWGAVSYDVPVPHGTPYETYFAIPDGATQARTHPRGYFPRNFLTATHLDALGGAAQVAARCAELGLRYQPVPRGDLPPGAVVGGEEPTLHTSDATLAAVRDLLNPILIHQSYTWYAGPPLRVFKEPGTAFRRVPPDIVTPWFDDDPPLEPDSGDARRLVPDV